MRALLPLMMAAAADAFLAPAVIRSPSLRSSSTSTSAASSLRMAGSFKKDTHVSPMSIITIKDSRHLADIQAFLPEVAQAVKANAGSVYFGALTSDDKSKMFIREGYTNGAGAAAGALSVEVGGKTLVDIIGKGNLDLSVCGPKDELAKVKSAYASLSPRYFDLVDGSLLFDCIPSGSPDKHVTIFPIFTVPKDNLPAFTAGFDDFFADVKTGTDKCFYYGFGVSSGSQAFCREGYADAEGALQHIDDVGAPLGKALALAGEGGLNLSIMGPSSQVDKMRDACTPLGATFYVLDEAKAFWK